MCAWTGEDSSVARLYPAPWTSGPAENDCNVLMFYVETHVQYGKMNMCP